MIDSQYQQRYWQATIANTGVAVALLMAILLFAGLFAGLLEEWVFLGFPFSFYFVAQGAFLLLIALIYWAQGRQERIERAHGAAEEI